jgi:membrane peptidoglycan carboxypeptidase
MTSAYSTFANNGVRNPYQGILRIEDRRGAILEEFVAHPDQVMEPEISLMMTDVLSDDKARERTFGLGSPLRIPGYDVAAKTGTTNDYRDAWFSGVTPDIAATVWIGHDDGVPMSPGKAGGSISAPVWMQFVKSIYLSRPTHDF